MQHTSNLDFLPEGTTLLANQAPDADGVVRVELKELGAHGHVTVVAVDPQTTVERRLALSERRAAPRDLRLTDGLDPKRPFAQQQAASVVQRGGAYTVEDITSSEFRVYDSLGSVHRLFRTLTDDPKLERFAFVLSWPKLSAEEKRRRYSELACHELSFFLSRKDPAFFAQVVKPYLRHKKDKTFLDHYLLGEDLARYLEPWAYGRLNVVEKLLLAQRITGEVQHTRRHLEDRFAVLPPRGDEVARLFTTALQSGALDAEDSLGLIGAKDKLKEARRLESLEKQSSRPGGPSDGYAFGDDADMALDEEEAEADDMPMPSMEAEPAEAPRAPPAPKARRARRAEAANGKGFFKADLKKRAKVRRHYRQLDTTKEWAENNYFELPIQEQVADLVEVNGFWVDYARSGSGGFLSPRVIEAAGNFTEMMFALSLLDLPFESAEHTTAFEGAAMTLTAGSSALLFHEGIRAAQPTAAATPILVSQNAFRHGDRHQVIEGERVDKFVAGEFVVHTVYGCQVVVTNPTSSRQRLTVLLQVPQGAIPVLGGRTTRSVRVTLDPYRTQSIDYHFYFPRPGRFAHYPVHVAKDGQIVAAAKPATFEVVATPSSVDTTTWEHVSQRGTPAQVLAFLEERNLEEVDLSRMAWRLGDARFFALVTEALRRRHAFDAEVWAYAVRHDARREVRELLDHQDGFVRGLGGVITSPVLTVDPVARHAYQHLEYYPLVNARAHKLGAKRQILNDRFHAQYSAFLRQLCYRSALADADLLVATHYLLLQDRVEEALAFFGRIEPGRLETRLQYDYCAAYLAMSTGAVDRAGEIAKRHADHPVDRWRAAFAAVAAQVAEVKGAAASVADPKDPSQEQAGLAARAIALDLKVESRQVALDYQNCEQVEVNYYLMDLELLFSRNPFVQQVSSQFAYIQPNGSEVRRLGAKSGRETFALPERFHTANVLVEVRGGGQTRSVPHYANSLVAQMIEPYGQVRVTAREGGKPLAAAYVKVYARTKAGEVRFFKDGYTDLRGKFDYATLSTNDLDHVAEFALLVVSDDHGAVVKRARPPQR
jgi:hypothetical protein